MFLIHYFDVTDFFRNFDIKNGCKNNFEDTNEKFAADPKIGFLTKSILNPS